MRALKLCLGHKVHWNERKILTFDLLIAVHFIHAHFCKSVLCYCIWLVFPFPHMLLTHGIAIAVFLVVLIKTIKSLMSCSLILCNAHRQSLSFMIKSYHWIMFANEVEGSYEALYRLKRYSNAAGDDARYALGHANDLCDRNEPCDIIWLLSQRDFWSMFFFLPAKFHR